MQSIPCMLTYNRMDVVWRKSQQQSTCICHTAARGACWLVWAQLSFLESLDWRWLNASVTLAMHSRVVVSQWHCGCSLTKIVGACSSTRLAAEAWLLQQPHAREVGAKCCVAQSLDASPIQHKAAQQTTQSSTIKLQEPRPGSQSVMQAHNSQQARGEGINHLQPENSYMHGNAIWHCHCHPQDNFNMTSSQSHVADHAAR